ncbi:protein SOB FIVE-LIKE 5-like [Andrographis paniculata]|uniref:protein SOB FIVE-LIKE 5-like n=1 Tax=Andrographis paniculata TaxID=175694 RepID=UPI0021E95945|nr:protein SOB FIVE-LIKE 5-like [Andrographis paniculata]
MNLSGSECSSGCESGWTRYLNHFSNCGDPYNNNNSRSRGFVDEKGVYIDDDYDDDEDLSMVSDASSGPPPPQQFQEYLHHNQDCAFENQKMKNKQEKMSRTKEGLIKCKKRQSLSCLDDDTASSPICQLSQGNVAHQDHLSSFSQVFSSAHVEDDCITKNQFGFFKVTAKGKSGSFLGRKRQ